LAEFSDFFVQSMQLAPQTVQEIVELVDLRFLVSVSLLDGIEV